MSNPNSDHLLICRIDAGNEKVIQVVTGAHNIKVGQIVPVALPGAHIPAKHDAGAPGGISHGDIDIKSGELRGIKSEGMLCSCGELGLDTDLFPEVSRKNVCNIHHFLPG